MALPNASARRERSVIVGGALIVALALLTTYGILPFARHWRLQSARLDAARSRVAYLHELVSRTNTLERAASGAERSLSTQTRRVVHARSSTLAASTMQGFLQDVADANHVVVTRLEVSSDDSVATAEGVGVAYVPATLSAYGDVVGVTGVLRTIATGPRVVLVDRVALQRNAALAGAADVVQVTMRVRAPVLPE
ncbi:MAG: hypothetical protein IT353_00780 [Gemmatimonadaceae bacterium]|nr:hypothetical protein [Gemmatimonadaceae bacterium]